MAPPIFQSTRSAGAVTLHPAEAIARHDADRGASDRRVVGYGVAVLAVGSAAVLNWLLWDMIKPQAGALFLAAVLVSAWYGGFGPGVLASVLATVGRSVFYAEPIFSPLIESRDFLLAPVFLTVALLVNWLTAARKAATEALERARGELETRVAERTAELTAANAKLREEVDERMRAEQALRASEERFRSVARSAADGIFSTDSDGRVLSWNDAAGRMFGFTEAEVIGRSLESLMPREFHEVHLRGLEQLAKPELGRVSRRLDLPGLRKDGTTFPCELSLSSWTQGGQRYYAGIIRDVTERRRAEEQSALYNERLRHLASELSRAEERERRKIATRLHDDIGQRLASAQIMLDGLPKRATAGELARIAGEVRELIEETIAHARSLTCELSPPVVYEMGFEDALHWLAGQVCRRHNLPVRVESDGRGRTAEEQVRVVLFQAVRELLMNVIKHANAGCARVVVTGSDAGGLRVSVEDDGQGFDPASNAPQSGDGAGFGLFNIRERICSMGGSFAVESAVGRGCVVRLEVPARLESQAAAPPTSRGEQHGH